MKKAMVILPTYNEKENLQTITRSIHEIVPEMHITIVDDNSPDGTGQVAADLAKEDERIHVIHRPRKMGLGTAYITGFQYALEQGMDYIMEMDADFSHDPRYIPQFLEKIENCDFVVGSRYLTGVRVDNWSFRRLLLSKFATLYVNLITGMHRDLVSDATSGFKCFRREVLEAIDLDRVGSTGYAFQIEMTYKAYRLGFRIGEIRIMFVERETGYSKMSFRITLEAVWQVWKLRLGSWIK